MDVAGEGAIKADGLRQDEQRDGRAFARVMGEADVNQPWAVDAISRHGRGPPIRVDADDDGTHRTIQARWRSYSSRMARASPKRARVRSRPRSACSSRARGPPASYRAAAVVRGRGAFP